MKFVKKDYKAPECVSVPPTPSQLPATVVPVGTVLHSNFCDYRMVVLAAGMDQWNRVHDGASMNRVRLIVLRVPRSSRAGYEMTPTGRIRQWMKPHATTLATSWVDGHPPGAMSAHLPTKPAS